MTDTAHRQTLGDLLRRSAARAPDRLAVACGDTRWTYAQFDGICDRLAAGLAQQGVGRGVRVGILAHNSHAFVAMRFAVARLGAVLVPINFMLKAAEVAHILRHAGVMFLAADSALAPLGQAAAALHGALRQVIWLPAEEPAEPEPEMIRFEDLAGCAAPLPEVALAGRELAQIIYTSGTESLPKGAMLSHEAVIWQYVSCVVDARLSLRTAGCLFRPVHLRGGNQRHHGPPTPRAPVADDRPTSHQLVLCAPHDLDCAVALAALRGDGPRELAQGLLWRLDHASRGAERNTRQITRSRSRASGAGSLRAAAPQPS